MNRIGRRLASAVCALTLALSFGVKSSAVSQEPTEAVNANATECASGVKVSSRLWELLFGEKESELVLIPGGGVFGAKVTASFVTVSDAKDISGINNGDVILSINGSEIRSIKDVKEVMKESDGKEMPVVLERNGATISLSLAPKKVGQEYRLGIQLRDGAAGIGTITYINPKTGEFGGLGHGICDTGSGKPIEITGGEVTGVILGGVQKGEEGKPGELRGILTDRCLGEVYTNTACGVFGKLNTLPNEADCIAVEVGRRECVHEGEAKIISTIKNGHTSEFKIEITEIDQSASGSKSFRIKVTDEALKALTGGIVRGMGV